MSINYVGCVTIVKDMKTSRQFREGVLRRMLALDHGRMQSSINPVSRINGSRDMPITPSSQSADADGAEKPRPPSCISNTDDVDSTMQPVHFKA